MSILCLCLEILQISNATPSMILEPSFDRIEDIDFTGL